MNLSKQKENMFVNTVGAKQIQCLVDLVQEAHTKITNLREIRMIPPISAELHYFGCIFNANFGSQR